MPETSSWLWSSMKPAVLATSAGAVSGTRRMSHLVPGLAHAVAHGVGHLRDVAVGGVVEHEDAGHDQSFPESRQVMRAKLRAIRLLGPGALTCRNLGLPGSDRMNDLLKAQLARWVRVPFGAATHPSGSRPRAPPALPHAGASRPHVRAGPRPRRRGGSDGFPSEPEHVGEIAVVHGAQRAEDALPDSHAFEAPRRGERDQPLAGEQLPDTPSSSRPRSRPAPNTRSM